MHVYVINLQRSVDRREHITAELQKIGVDFEIVTAVDGRDLDLTDACLVHPELLAKNAFPQGTAGCALSHLECYRRIIAAGLDCALILEDDVTLPPDLGVLADAVAGHMTGPEVALLNYGSPHVCKMSMDGAVDLPAGRRLALPIDIGPLVNAAAYLITREACERMIQKALPLRANADDWQYLYRQQMLDRIRCVLPMAVDKESRFESTIGLYSLGSGMKGRLVRPLVRHNVPVVNQYIRRRRQRILAEWGRAEVVDAPFVEKPSRLA
jgi:glycosyl transferase, family 25